MERNSKASGEKVECSCSDIQASPVERRARVVGKSGEPVSRRQGRGEGSGVDEQFARERRLRLSAVGATLQLHRRGRDKLGVEDAGERKGKWRSGARQ